MADAGMEESSASAAVADTTGRVLGYLGLLPFVGALLAMLVLPLALRQFALLGMMTYGAVVLSFIGAVHWGWTLAMRAERPGRRLAISVLPALVGWAAVPATALVPTFMGIGVLMAAFVLWYAYERLGDAWTEFPTWYRALRTQLTAGVLVLLAIALVIAG